MDTIIASASRPCTFESVHFLAPLFSSPNTVWIRPLPPYARISSAGDVPFIHPSTCFSACSANVSFPEKMTCHFRVPERDGRLVGHDTLNLKKVSPFHILWNFPNLVWLSCPHLVVSPPFFSSFWLSLSKAIQLGFHWNSHPLSFLTHHVINLCNLIELRNYSNKHSWHEEVWRKKQRTVGRYTTEQERRNRQARWSEGCLPAWPTVCLGCLPLNWETRKSRSEKIKLL